jgi:hypothetical protein
VFSRNGEHGPIPRCDTGGKFHKSTIYHRYYYQFVSIVQCICTSGTVGKIGLRIVKVSLPSVNQGPCQFGYPSKSCGMVQVVPLVRYGTDRESKFTIREPRAMAVGVPFKRISNGTSGTVGKIGLGIVKVNLLSVNQGTWQLGYPSKVCRMVPVVPLVR